MVTNFDPLAQDYYSPLVAEIRYYLNQHWNVTGDISWQFAQHRVYDATANFQYRGTTNQIVNLGYNYVADGDADGRDLNRLDLSTSWPIYHYWTAFADWNYNISFHNPQTYFFGLQYNSCCWAIRFVDSRNFIGYDASQNSILDHRYYLQFLLKGLGSAGVGGSSDLLRSRIGGFVDDFVRG